MKCAVCHGKMVEKKGEIELRIGGRLYIVRNVSYDECTSCGERILSPGVSQMLYDKINNREYTEENITLPVLDGTFG